MRKRHVVAGLVMLLASAVSYRLVQMTEARPAIEVIEATHPVSHVMVDVTTAVPSVAVPSSALGVATLFHSMSDTTMLFATGVALLGIAAGVRRHT